MVAFLCKRSTSPGPVPVPSPVMLSIEVQEPVVLSWPTFVVVEDDAPLLLQEPATDELYLGFFSTTDKLERFCFENKLAPSYAVLYSPLVMLRLLQMAQDAVTKVAIDFPPVSAQPHVLTYLTVPQLLTFLKGVLQRDPSRN